MRVPKRLQQQAGRYALVDGIPFSLPVNSEHTPALIAAFPIDAARAAELLPGADAISRRAARQDPRARHFTACGN